MSEQDAAVAEKQKTEEVAEFFRREYAGKKVPRSLSEFRIGSLREGDGVPFTTLDTGAWEGQITVAAVRFRDGRYEFREFRDPSGLHRFDTLDQVKERLAALVSSLTAEELDRCVSEALRRGR